MIPPYIYEGGRVPKSVWRKVASIQELAKIVNDKGVLKNAAGGSKSFCRICVSAWKSIKHFFAGSGDLRLAAGPGTTNEH